MQRTPTGSTRSGVLGLLTEFGQALVGAVTFDHVVDRVASALDQLVAPDGLLIVLTDREGGAPRVVRALGSATPRADHPLVGLAARKGPLLLGANVATRLATYGITLPDPPGSWIGAPLVAGSPLGAISLTAAEPGRFTRDTLDIVRAIVTQAAIALQNARLLTALSEGKREWEQTVDAITQGICVIDSTGGVRRANRTFCELADIPLTAVAGKPWLSLVPPGWADAIGDLVQDPNPATTIELRAGDRLFLASALALTDAGTAATVLVVEDQTDRRRLQDQLFQSEKMSAIGQLIAGVAHDLNNPLASVVGFADYLVETAGAAPPEMLEPLRAIQQEAERAANIVKNLLGFARKQERRRQVISVEELVSSTLLLLRNELLAGKIEAHVQIGLDVPDVNVDANQIRQVLMNLITNAVQAVATQGGGHITVRAMPWLDGAGITVADDGPGVPPALAERIFEPFFTTKPAGSGTGLGLSICQGILKEHGGRLALVSADGGGATFRVELPAGSAPRGHEPRPSPVPAALRVLVIDDEPHIQHYMRATLEAWGHTVTVAHDGVTGFANALAEPYDVIITDLRMPEVGGREMFERLTLEHPDLARRVVFSTGDTVRGDTLAFLESLGRPYLRKPFSLAELRSAVADAVQRAGLRARA